MHLEAIFCLQRRRLFSEPTPTNDTIPSPHLEEISHSYMERALSLIGITRVDDAEYLKRLKAKREMHLKRIRELEA